MKRRQFILGLGAASTGGSALIGSGAFTSVAAERDIAVDVVGDEDAFLRLGPCRDDEGDAKPNGAYVDTTDGLLSISLSDDNENSPPDGSGVNNHALSKFHNVFEICNHGTQPVCVNFGVSGEGSIPQIPEGADVPDRFEFGPGDDAVVFYKNGNENDTIGIESSDPDTPEAFELDVGECQCIGFNVRAFGFDSGDDLFADLDLTIIADAEAECGEIEEPPECAFLQSSISCFGTADGSDSPLNTVATVENVGGGSTAQNSVGFAILDSPDQSNGLYENNGTAGPGEDDTVPIDSGLPLRGIVFWENEEDALCEGATKETWSATENGLTHVASEAIGQGSGSLASLSEERYEEVEEIEDYGDFRAAFDGGVLPGDDDDLDDVVPDDAFIAEINMSEYQIDSEEDWSNGDVGIPECDEIGVEPEDEL